MLVLFSFYVIADVPNCDDIAAGGIGQFIADGDTIYAVDTDWGSYSSTLEAITVVPEPATLSMVLLGGFAIWRRKNRS